MTDFDGTQSHIFHGRGPYGTNLGDIWSGEHSEVGRMLLEEKNYLLIHEVLMNEETGHVGDSVYSVDLNDLNDFTRDLVKRAREGIVKWMAAQSRNN
jgi:hypothetical protein